MRAYGSLPGPPLAALLIRTYGGLRVAAAAVGVDPSAVSHWAAGRRHPGFWTVDRVCVAAGVHPAEVYGDAWTAAAESAERRQLAA